MTRARLRAQYRLVQRKYVNTCNHTDRYIFPVYLLKYNISLASSWSLTLSILLFFLSPVFILHKRLDLVTSLLSRSAILFARIRFDSFRGASIRRYRRIRSKATHTCSYCPITVLTVRNKYIRTILVPTRVQLFHFYRT